VILAKSSSGGEGGVASGDTCLFIVQVPQICLQIRVAGTTAGLKTGGDP